MIGITTGHEPGHVDATDALAIEADFVLRACGCDQSRACPRCKGIGEYRVSKSDIPKDHPEPPGRIDLRVLEANPDAIRVIVDERVKAYLARYGFTYTITGFAWDQGRASGQIDLVPVPPITSSAENVAS